eukprot:SAG11_NODE_7024_length_1207_cov_0.758123_2_plen_112_part_00
MLRSRSLPTPAYVCEDRAHHSLIKDADLNTIADLDESGESSSEWHETIRTEMAEAVAGWGMEVRSFKIDSIELQERIEGEDDLQVHSISPRTVNLKGSKMREITPMDSNVV